MQWRPVFKRLAYTLGTILIVYIGVHVYNATQLVVHVTDPQPTILLPVPEGENGEYNGTVGWTARFPLFDYVSLSPWYRLFHMSTQYYFCVEDYATGMPLRERTTGEWLKVHGYRYWLDLSSREFLEFQQHLMENTSVWLEQQHNTFFSTDSACATNAMQNDLGKYVTTTFVNNDILSQPM